MSQTPSDLSQKLWLAVKRGWQSIQNQGKKGWNWERGLCVGEVF